MNKEKILNKIGALIDKAELTEDDLAKFFQEEEAPKAPETESEQPKEEVAQEETETADVESAKEEGETAPEDEKAEVKAEDEPKTSSEAVPETEAEADTHITKDEVIKLIEGYKAEIDSLKEVLRKAGVLENVAIKDKQVGYGTASPDNLKRDKVGMEATLAKLNKGR
jgi:6-pyruvoyl-tetrahydropterin synthase